MSDFTRVDMLWLFGGFVLAIAALAAYRPSLGAIVRALLGWLVVAGIAWTIIVHHERVKTIMSGVADRLGIGAQSVDGDTVRIAMSTDGHFWARANLNGVEKRLLIDSGATITALSPTTARAAGIVLPPPNTGFPVTITTANGTVLAQRGRIETVRIGGLETRDLGVVVSPAFGNVDVLGMNFLSRLGSWRVEGRTLILEPKPRVADANPGRTPSPQTDHYFT
ncbi:MAG: TIGR02281 family clan AA aspartic protease [Pseudomonadota bacterium]